MITVWIILPSDNRLLVKEVQPVEMSSFEEIAPKYFQYISSAVNKEVCCGL